MRQSGEQALRHLFGALLVSTPEEIPIIGPEAGPWCQVWERVSRNLRAALAYSIVPIFAEIRERSDQLTTDQFQDVGKTARRLLEFAWSNSPRNSRLVVNALEAVCRTFESDTVASASMVRRCLEYEHMVKYGFEEMPWLAHEVKSLISSDPSLVEEIYEAAFNFQEDSLEETPIGPGRILPLISNRRQDYRMTVYELANIFPGFLECAARNATSALIKAMEAYITQEHSYEHEKFPEKAFDFKGQRAIIRGDYSAIWDENSLYRDDEALKMLDTFQQHLEKLSGKPGSLEKLREIVQVIISHNVFAVIWRRLLMVGTLFPDTLGREIRSIAWSLPIISGYDTSVPACNFLNAIYPELNEEERERVETTILSIAETCPEISEPVDLRNRLLGCLADFELISPDARRLIDRLKDENDIPANEPPVRFKSWSSPYGEEEFLLEEGVPIDEDSNRKIRELEIPAKEFKEKYLNSVPTMEVLHSVLPDLRALNEALFDTKSIHILQNRRDCAWGNYSAACARIARIVFPYLRSFNEAVFAKAYPDIHPKQRYYAWGYLSAACAHIARIVLPHLRSFNEAVFAKANPDIHPKQRNYALGNLAAACACIARIEGLSCDNSTGKFAKEVLLGASWCESPIPDLKIDAQFDETPSWGGPSPRIEAAEGLIILARQPTCTDKNLLAAINRLSEDPVPAVRFQIAKNINVLLKTAPELMYRLIERMCKKEESRGVLMGLLGGPLQRLAGLKTDWIADLAIGVFERIEEGAGAKKVRELCVGLISDLYIWRNHVKCGKVILDIANTPSKFPDETSILIASLENPLNHGSIHSDNPMEKAIRERAFDLVGLVLRSARKGLFDFDQSYGQRPFEEWPAQDQDAAKNLGRVINQVAQKIYFASGAHNNRGQPHIKKVSPVTYEMARRFYTGVRPILDELADTGFPSVTHHLLKTMQYFIPFDPQSIFLTIGRVVRAGERGGYQYETLAADLMVILVEQYLAEYRTLLKENTECRQTLVDILDIFVKVGWPSTRRLVYRLEEIYR